MNHLGKKLDYMLFSSSFSSFSSSFSSSCGSVLHAQAICAL